MIIIHLAALSGILLMGPEGLFLQQKAAHRLQAL